VNHFNLSARQVEVVELLSRGLTINQIGLKLRIRSSTTYTHVKRAYQRLGVNNRTSAAVKFLNHQLGADPTAKPSISVKAPSALEARLDQNLKFCPGCGCNLERWSVRPGVAINGLPVNA
jgi:DNA-binding CsgD family transcriptional regulator